METASSAAQRLPSQFSPLISTHLIAGLKIDSRPGTGILNLDRSVNHVSDITMEPQYRFTFSEEFLLAAFLRYRRQVPWRNAFNGLKGVLAFISVAIGAFLAVMVQLWLLIPFAAIAGALYLVWPIDSWIMRRRFRKSPYYNDEVAITISEEGLRGTGKVSETTLGWKIFTKARRFSDGLLLFHGPHSFNWLPDSAAIDINALSQVEQLVRSHVQDFRDV